MEAKLTYEDVDILIEAVDAWRDRGAASAMMGSLITGMFKDRLSPEKQLEMEQAEERKQREREIQRRKDETTATLIKAKLMQMRDNLDVLVEDMGGAER